MKRLLVFILISLSSFPKAAACYFYPYGEDIRFSFLNPENIGYNGYKPYFYSSAYFYSEWSDEDYNKRMTANDLLWSSYCNGKVDLAGIEEAMYTLKIPEITRNSKNSMLRYLYRSKDNEALDYILFAKKSEAFSDGTIDLWEKDEDKLGSKRTDYIEIALRKAKTAKHAQIRKRYLFQAIKLARYKGDDRKIIALYNTYFNYPPQDIIDYWAMYFRAVVERNPVYTNYLAAQVFANAPGKRFDIRYYFNRHIPAEEILSFAKTKEEVANIYLMYAVRKSDQALTDLERIYKVQPNAEGLSLLLLREVNKIEDWLLTPQYAMFLPSIRDDYWENSNNYRILQRVEVDREYSRKVLDFVNKADLTKVENPDFWKMAQAYLLFLNKDYAQSLQKMNALEPKLALKKDMLKQLKLLKGLCLTAAQEKGKAIIPKEVRPLLMEEYNQKHSAYIFAIGKELENLGNATDAALLFSKTNNDEDDYSIRRIYWKDKKGRNTLWDDFYDNWFAYLDASYDAPQMEKLINSTNTKTRKTVFDAWLYSNLSSDKNRLYDLMGIKYIRENNLKKAQLAFSSIDNSYEVNGYFDANPFLKLKDGTVFNSKASARHLTKASVTQQLMNYLAKAENPNEKNRSYYYLLAGNCYYNMSYYGNAWMMRRIFWSSNESFESRKMPDETEYYQCNLAKKYYLLAQKTARSEKYKALSLYMAMKCERRAIECRLNREHFEWNRETNSKNKLYKEIVSKYPSDYDELSGHCEAFEEYFNSRF